MTEGGSIGGKARGLKLLEECGCTVPHWSVVPSEVFDMQLDALAIGDEVRALLEGLPGSNPSEISSKLLALFQGAELAPPVIARIHAAYDAVGGAVAVRSSALQEDGKESSFAGVHATFLNVRSREEVVARVLDTWLSTFSPQALTYRSSRNIEPRESMAVVIQEMVHAAKSGVLFTADPTTGSRDEMVLSSVFGVGEGLVSGAVDADTVVVDKATGRVLSSYIGEKAEAHQAGADHAGIRVEPVAEDARETMSLDDNEITALCALGRRIEEHAGLPQDIEWAIDADGAIAMLQARPLTALDAVTLVRRAPADGELRIWDNSNILESFGAVTAPLTFSFARYAYYRAYREYTRLVGLPRRMVDQMDEWLPNMLGQFDGRVYYNLLNWYKVIRLLPGYTLNRQILELSMGLGEALPDDVALAQVPFRAASSLRQRALEYYVYARFAVHFLTIEKSVDRFLRYFNERFQEFEMTDLEEQDSLSVYRHFQMMEQDLLPQFGRMVLLEATVAMSFGALSTLTKKWLPDAAPGFEFEVARPKGPIESTKPADRMAELARQVVADPALSAALDGPPETAVSRLRDTGYGDFAGRVDAYIREFGHRSANELKLEEPDMRDDPGIFFRLLADATDASAPDRADVAANPADAVIRANLSGWKRVTYGVVRSKVQRALQARESVRFARSRAFGMTRRMMKAIGRDLHAVGAIGDPRDIFFLELDELRGYMEGRGSAAELREMIALRRKVYDAADPNGPARFETRGAPYWGQDAAPAPSGADHDGALRGTPCVPGVVDGEVRVVSEPTHVNGNILATYRTDPGWITVLPTVTGLLIERGSPLTHVAIAAREFGIPTIVQIPGLTERLQSGDRIRIDGSDGRIEIVDRARTDEAVATAGDAS